MNALAQAIKQHAAKSVLDPTPAHALDTMIAALFNLLGCRPMSASSTIEESYYIDLKMPARLKELPTIKHMIDTYLEQVQANTPFRDLLSEVMAEFQGSDRRLCQHLTPWNLACGATRLMDLGSPDIQAKVARGEMIEVSDPTGCGAGALLLAFLSKIHNEAPELLPFVHVTGVDIDARMARATAVQLIWNSFVHGLPLGRVTVWHADVIAEYLVDKVPAIVHRGWGGKASVMSEVA